MILSQVDQLRAAAAAIVVLAPAREKTGEGDDGEYFER